MLFSSRKAEGGCRGRDASVSSSDESPRSIWPTDLPREALEELYERLRPSARSDPELLESIQPHVEYEPGAELGHGGMGVVRSAWDENLRRVVAMKLVRRLDPLLPGAGARPSAERASLLGRFLREARITGQLSHPGIIPVHALGRLADGTAYFTMPVVRGNDLGAVFAWSRAGTHGWSLPRALGILLRVCETLAYAHQRGVIHRDLKPDNVMVGAFGETYVLDWGLAKVLEEPEQETEPGQEGARPPAEPDVDPGDAADLTHEGAALGSASFMAPEQAAGKLSEIGPPADVYAVGAMLYTLLAGRRPYQDEHGSRTRAEVVAAVLAGPPRPLAELAPRQPPALLAIAQKAMAREPAGRYGSMGALAQDLRAFLENRVVQAHRTGAWIELSKWVQRNKGVAAAAALLALTIVGALAWNAEVQAAGRRAVVLSADVSLLPYLESQAEALWPAHPENLPALDDWLAQAEGLVARKPLHEAQLRALAPTDAAATDGASPTSARSDDRIAYEKQSTLVLGVERLASEKGRLREVRARRAFAATVVERTLEGTEAARLWAEAVEAIVSAPLYGGLSIAPQLGLLPIGPDPDSGLWEFAHVQTGEPARRAADGRLILEEATGLVFVLLPGGTFTMGASTQDDRFAGGHESPVHEVTLAPFFLSKYEMTQGQWLRVMGANPSCFHQVPADNELHDLYGVLPFSFLSPVESVSWLDCQGLLRRLQLAFPTEAQWEYAARAGADGPWYTGPEMEQLAGAANLRDRFWARVSEKSGVPPREFHDWMEDGFAAHAPVGQFEPNAFGLHDVLGNVEEWCLDYYEYYHQGVAPGTGERLRPPKPNVLLRVLRGGHSGNLASDARASARETSAHDLRDMTVGLRPARAVE